MTRQAGSQSAPPSTADRLVPLGHWVYAYVERLRSRGFLPDLDPLVQPYRRAQLAADLRGLDPDTLPEPVAEWVRLLRQEFVGAVGTASEPRVGVTLSAGARGATTQRLDAVRPVGDGSVWPWALGSAWFEAGPLTGESGVRFDRHIPRDPDQRTISLRMGGVTDNTYLSLAAGPGVVTLGRFDRNWGPAGTPGVLVSDNPMSYPSVGFDLRLGPIAFNSFGGELDTMAATHRYLAANRVAYTTPRTTVALTEAVLYSGGGRGLSLQFLIPSILQFEHENPPGEDLAENLMLGLEVRRNWGRVETYFEGLLDDIDLSPPPGLSRAATRYALTAQVRWRPVGERVEAAVQYQRVSSFAYRSNRPVDEFDYLGRGLGPNFADYDHLVATLDFFPRIRGLQLTPAVEVLRQGEGDFRVPFPGDSVLRISPSLFLGVVETTWRAALRGRYQPRRAFWISWDVGPDWIRNAGHLTGVRQSKFVALVSAGARLEFGGRVGSGR